MIEIKDEGNVRKIRFNAPFRTHSYDFKKVNIKTKYTCQECGMKRTFYWELQHKQSGSLWGIWDKGEDAIYKPSMPTMDCPYCGNHTMIRKANKPYTKQEVETFAQIIELQEKGLL